MLVFVRFGQTDLMHVRVGVLGAVLVGVSVFVFDVVVLVLGVRMRVGDAIVLVLVRMRRFVGVRFGHRDHLLDEVRAESSRRSGCGATARNPSSTL